MNCEMTDCVNYNEYVCLTCIRFKAQRKDNYQSKKAIDEFVKRIERMQRRDYKAKRQVMPNANSKTHRAFYERNIPVTSPG